MCVRPLNETRRRLVLDTNVFLNNGFEAGAVTDFLERLEISRGHADKVLIPYVVLEELDRKRSQEEYSDTAKRAREVVRYLADKFTEQNSFWYIYIFSKVLYIVTLYSKYTRALTFQFVQGVTRH